MDWTRSITHQLLLHFLDGGNPKSSLLNSLWAISFSTTRAHSCPESLLTPESVPQQAMSNWRLRWTVWPHIVLRNPRQFQAPHDWHNIVAIDRGVTCETWVHRMPQEELWSTNLLSPWPLWRLSNWSCWCCSGSGHWSPCRLWWLHSLPLWPFPLVSSILGPRSRFFVHMFEALELRCSMAAFHLTLEENGRYLTLEAASLLQQQCVAGWAKLFGWHNIGIIHQKYSIHSTWPWRPWHHFISLSTWSDTLMSQTIFRW